MKRIITASCALLLLTAAGCGDPFSNDLLKGDVQFLQAAPNAELIRVDVPQHAVVLQEGQYLTQRMVGQGAPTCEEIAARKDAGEEVDCDARAESGEEALWHCFTANFTGEVNCGVLGFLELVDTILTFPPTAREADKRIWGPWPGDEGSRVDLRFEMVRRVESEDETEESARVIFDYALQVRSRDKRDLGAHEGWVDAMSGSSEPTSGTRYGTGELAFDVDAVRGEDPQELGQGRISVSYDTRPTEDAAGACESTSIDIAFENFRGGDQPPEEPAIDATYNYVKRDDCAGEFYYETYSDTDAGQNPLRHAKERLQLMIRWDPSGAGRADVRASEGDLLEEIIHSSECWDADFESSYLDYWDPNRDGGDPAACVLEAWDFGE